METKHVITIFGLAVMVAVFIFAARAIAAGGVQTNYNTASSGYQSSAPTQIQSGKQVVQLSMQNGNYYPNAIRVKKGIPVEIDVDLNSVRGCYRTIKIPAFGIQKTLTDADNKIEFTPDKAGTFGFSCIMGMGTGQLIVEDEAGNVPATNTVSQDIPKGGSCGAGGGGCGCGG
ncbi:MAG: cupredoxin domain-containing protein [Candidatus Aenigmarchaeota archaeon]|nr:cupredoxin domain-containing protein [Candidatus Aenigmarchaeota archaeon]